MTSPPPFDVVYTNTHTVTSIFDIWNWQTNEPLQGLTWGGTAQISAPVSQTIRIYVRTWDGPHPNTTVGYWEIPAGFVGPLYPTFTSAFEAGTQHLYFQTAPSANWTTFPTFTTTLNFTWTNPPPNCQYGTEANPEASIYTTVTVALVDIIVVLLGGGPLMITAFDALIGSPLFAYSCDIMPPTAPEFSDADFLGDTGIVTPGSWWKLMDLFRVGVWHFYCRCKDGGVGQPPPIPPPIPDPGPPLTDPGPQPKLPCSDADMCQVLNIIVRQINSISLNIQFNRQTNNYFPGPAQAFNYQLGLPHPGLYGSGYLDISGLVGLRVEISSRPESTTVLAGNPPYLWNMGWMSIDDTDGMLEEKRVTRDSFVWFPVHIQQAEQFGWNLGPEVVLTVWELLPAPA